VQSGAVLSLAQKENRSIDLLWNLTLRELRGKYRRSFLGWGWSLLNPLALVAIYSFVFGVVFGAEPPVGENSGVHNYALYLLCGLLPWAFFNLVTGLGMNSLLNNAGLVRKVAFPRQTLVLAQSLFSVVQFSIEMTLLTIVLSLLGSPVWKWIPVVAFVMVLLALFSTGIGLCLSVWYVYFRDLNYLWSIVVQVYFFATPIIYNPEILTGNVPGWVEGALRWNPMAVFVESFRNMMYDGKAPIFGNICGLLAVSVGMFVLGLLVFARGNRRLAEEL
jgi:ABC-type polysaccharide/polyol phosphate export permease